MARLTEWDEDDLLLVKEEERLLNCNGRISHDEMYKIMRHLAEKLAEYEDAEEQGLLANVVRGRWIDTTPDYHNGYYKNAHQCSNCQDYYTTEYDEMNYCPNCGAKMDGGRE